MLNCIAKRSPLNFDQFCKSVIVIPNMWEQKHWFLGNSGRRLSTKFRGSVIRHICLGATVAVFFSKDWSMAFFYHNAHIFTPWWFGVILVSIINNFCRIYSLRYLFSQNIFSQTFHQHLYKQSLNPRHFRFPIIFHYTCKQLFASKNMPHSIPLSHNGHMNYIEDQRFIIFFLMNLIINLFVINET